MSRTSTRINSSNKAEELNAPRTLKVQTGKSLISNVSLSTETKTPTKEFQKVLTTQDASKNFTKNSVDEDKNIKQESKSDFYWHMPVNNIKSPYIKLIRLDLSRFNTIKNDVSKVDGNSFQNTNQPPQKSILKDDLMETPETKENVECNFDINDYYSDSFESEDVKVKIIKEEVCESEIESENSLVSNDKHVDNILHSLGLQPFHQRSNINYNEDVFMREKSDSAEKMLRKRTAPIIYRDSKGDCTSECDPSESEDDIKDKTVIEEDCESESETEIETDDVISSENEEFGTFAKNKGTKNKKLPKIKKKRRKTPKKISNITSIPKSAILKTKKLVRKSSSQESIENGRKENGKNNFDINDYESGLFQSKDNGNDKIFDEEDCKIKSKSDDTKFCEDEVEEEYYPKHKGIKIRKSLRIPKIPSKSSQKANDEYTSDEDFFPFKKVNNILQLLSQNDLNDLIQELGLSKNKAELLTTRLKERNLLKMKETRSGVNRPIYDQCYRKYFADDSE